MTERRTYTEVEKQYALERYVAVGPAQASRDSGVPMLTISSWARRAGVHTNAPVKTKEATEALILRAAEMRAELKVRMLHKALDLLDRMDQPHIEFKGKDATVVTYPQAPAAAVQNYATSAAILLDKYRLEVGEATTITGSVSILAGLQDHETQTLTKILREAVESEA